MPPAHAGWRRRALRGFTAVASILALLATAMGWYSVHGLLGGINVSQALGADAPRSTGGEMNLLLIGLDSRKDQHGDDHPKAHAASLASSSAIFSATRSTALRARGLTSVSAAEGLTALPTSAMRAGGNCETLSGKFLGRNKN